MSRARVVTVLKATLMQSTGLTSGRRWRLRPRWALTLRCGHTGTRDATYAETGTKRGLKLSSTVKIADPPKRVRCRTCEREEQS